MAWSPSFVYSPAGPSTPGEEQYHFAAGIHSRPESSSLSTARSAEVPFSTPMPTSMPPIIVNQPACSACCKKPHTIVVQPPLTIPYALQPSFGAAVHDTVVYGPPVAEHATDAVLGSESQGAPGDSGSVELSDVKSVCLCRNGCACVGCLAHPLNNVTEQYLWSAFASSTAEGSPTAPRDEALALLGPDTPSAGWTQIVPADYFLLLSCPLVADIEPFGGLETVRDAVAVLDDDPAEAPRPGTATYAEFV